MENIKMEDLRPAVVIADSGVCEGIFTSYASALGWANQHGMNVSNVRGDVPFIDVQWPKYFKPIVARFTPEEVANIQQMQRIEQGVINASLDILKGPPTRKETIVFMPDEIQTALDRNLASGLRQLADAIEAGQIDGKCIDCNGNGFTGGNDLRAHLMLRIDLAAPIRQTLPNPFLTVDALNEKPQPDEAYANQTFLEGESREEFERDRMGQTGEDNARKMFGEKEKI